jgi:hypothetical protein
MAEFYFSKPYWMIRLDMPEYPKEAREKKRETYRAIKTKFPDFGMRNYKTEALAKMAAGKIKKAFPDVPLEISEAFSIGF